MNHCGLYVSTFFITGFWDIILRILSSNYETLPYYMKFDFIYYLKPYFKRHTLLSAALIAGFIGATCQLLIVNIASFPKRWDRYIPLFMVISFIISTPFSYPDFGQIGAKQWGSL